MIDSRLKLFGIRSEILRLNTILAVNRTFVTFKVAMRIKVGQEDTLLVFLLL